MLIYEMLRVTGLIGRKTSLAMVVTLFVSCLIDVFFVKKEVPGGMSYVTKQAIGECEDRKVEQGECDVDTE